jgi:hypothetical protein
MLLLRCRFRAHNCNAPHKGRYIHFSTQYSEVFAEVSRNIQVFLISKMNPREVGCEDRRWMELAQDRVQWRALIFIHQ